MNGNKGSISVLINGQRPAREYQHNGQVFIEGRHGSDFELQVRNNTGGRVMAVISVDGLSVIDGNLASSNSPGYVIGPYGTITIPGWKLNGSSAAKFSFSSKRESYSQLAKGGSQDCGVIGVMLWSEKAKPVIPVSIGRGADDFHPPYWKTGYTNPYTLGDFQSTDARGAIRASGATMNTTSDYRQMKGEVTLSAVATAEVANELGTAFGSQTTFNTVAASFEKDQVIDTMILYYDSVKGLQARGIVIEPARNTRYGQVPNPFPGGGCQPPSGWAG